MSSNGISARRADDRMAPDLIAGVSSYFRSHQWQHLTHLLQTQPQTTHIHLFVETSLHPHSLEAIIKGYLAGRGWSVNRGNEILSPAPGRGTLHGIHPRGKPHFDLNWRFKADTVLAPMPEADAEQGQNILYWDDVYMSYFYRNYEWRPCSSEEEAELERYFKSQHWRKSFQLIQDPSIVHIHVNVDISIHPRVLAQHAVRAIAAEGWKLHRVVPNVFRSQGTYYGKFMFLFEEPEYSFDMSWLFNKDVVIAPCSRQIFPGNAPEYLIVPASDLDTLLARDPYRTLSPEEIGRCLAAIDDLACGTVPTS